MKDVPNLEGYFATEDGEIVSVRSGSKRIIKQRLNDGYYVVTLAVSVGGLRQRHRLQAHRLILMAYAGLPAADRNIARHLNGQSTDNRSVNLAWGTAKDNAQDSIRHGTLGPGMKARRRKLTDVQVREIIARRKAGESSARLSIEFGVHEHYIPRLCSGKAWPCLAQA
ncbi:NUMOD4 domain-containing protein [Pseudomonas petrae]|uniref:HNH endonuclease n=1 Tax=Pseudomonas petrae TaxID=2912190 RepID=A0ABS9IDS0_9PSED|nr:HNH endonuclease [Pseudomonas petrae]MCF7545564.1 HNH endonuclease [Pseudomonas petrae]